MKLASCCHLCNNMPAITLHQHSVKSESIFNSGQLFISEMFFLIDFPPKCSNVSHLPVNRYLENLFVILTQLESCL